MAKEKAKDMKLYTPKRRGFFGGENFSLHKVSPGTKKLEKHFTVGEWEDDHETKYKKSDYKKINDYIKENGINVINKEDFKWLK